MTWNKLEKVKLCNTSCWTESITCMLEIITTMLAYQSLVGVSMTAVCEHEIIVPKVVDREAIRTTILCIFRGTFRPFVAIFGGMGNIVPRATKKVS